MDKKMYDLTAPQKSIWLTEQYYTNSNINNICGTAIVSEILDLDLLRKAISNVIEKNDIFRLHFVENNGNLKQYFEKTESKPIEIIELDSKDDISTLEQKLLTKVFNINEDLYEFKIFRVEKSNISGFMLNIHHIKADAITLGLCSKKIMQEYIALSNNENIETNEKSTYENYINSEIEYQNSKKYESDKLYWEEKFKDIPNIVTIPSNKKDSTEFSYKSNRYNYLVDKEKMNKIIEFCANSKISVFNLFMGILSIYMYRVNNINDFVIGTPILNRTNFVEKNTLGMFINVAPLRVNVNDNSTILEFLSNIATDSMGLLRHQKYSYQSILENIRKINPSIPNLYNIVLSYQITKANLESDIDYETRWAFNGTCLNDIDIHLFDLDNTGELNIAYDYNVDKYDEQDIVDINTRLNYLIDQVLENSSVKIQDLEIATPEERDLILNVFNNTKVDYPSDKTIVELFEEQVELHPDNIAVVFEDEKLTYRELNEKANQLANYLYSQKEIIMVKTNWNYKTINPPIIAIYLNKSINYIISILATLKIGCSFMPISCDYPNSRIQHMIKDSEACILISSQKFLHNIKTSLKIIDIGQINLKQKENYQIEKQNITNTAYIIYTSGSTGVPKAVGVSQKSLINHVIGIQNRFENNITSADIALSIANISFDANIQEIFIPILYGATLHLLEDNSIYDSIKLAKYIYENKITFTFIPPTLLDILYEELCKYPKIYINKMLVGVQSIYNTTLNNYFNLNPNMKIHNGYGPTEATICCISTMYNEKNNNDKFILPIGKPMNNCNAYILDSNGKIQPPLVVGELSIGGYCISNGYVKLPKKTKEKFITVNSINNTYIYKTGDLAYFDKMGIIHFVGRKDNQIKLHGFRIELEEINSVISKNSKIKSSYTLLFKENHISSFIVPKDSSNFDMNKLKIYLKKKLPYYMIPTNIIQLDKLPQSKNGKVDYSHLIDLLTDYTTNTTKEFHKAENNTETKIENILKEILHQNKINFNYNLFELGGDSLTAIKLCSAIKNEFNIDITVKEVFEIKNLKELSLLIDNSNTKKSNLNSFTYATNSDYYPLSAAQKRIFYTSNISDKNTGVYNISGGLKFFEKLNFKKIQHIFNKLIERHESFRTFFIIENEEIHQKIYKTLSINIEKQYTTSDRIESEFKIFNTNFNLQEAPLLKIKVLYLENNITMIFINMHHIISDGASMQILLDEFCKLYNNEKLPIKKFTYRDFINYEKYFIGSDNYIKNKKFWLNEFKGELPILNLPTTYNRPSQFTYKGSKIEQILDIELSNKIKEFCKNIQVTPYMFFLATYYILLYKYTGQHDIIIGTPSANRDISSFSNIIGMFVNTLAIRKNIDSSRTFIIFLEEIKNKCLNCFIHQNYPFDELVNELNIQRDISRNPLFDTMFIYQSTGRNDFSLNNISTKYFVPDTNCTKFDLSLEIIPQNDTFLLNSEYCTDLFNKNFIKHFQTHYITLLKNILLTPYSKISNLEILTAEEKNNILYNFNNTTTDYPKQFGVAELFEEQVLKTPNNIAINFEDKKLTYKELNQKANQLAHFIEKENLDNEDIICILLDKSIEVIVSILAILKLGCAYLPIDSNYPKDRIDYILKDSKSKLLLTSQNLITKSNSIIKSICIDLDLSNIYNSNNIDNPIYKAKSSNLGYIMYTSGSTGNPKGVMIEQKSIIRLVKNTNYITFLPNDRILQTGSIVFDACTFEIWGALLNGLPLYIIKKEDLLDVSKLQDYILKHKISILWITAPLLNQLCEENPHMFSTVRCLLTGGDILSPKHINLIKTANPDLTIINGYGPTENTTFSCCYTINKKFKNAIPIGYPISNSTCYIVSQDSDIQPIGVPGELLVGGDGVARGYFNNPDLTKKSFTFFEHSNTKVYKTGDLAKWNEDGTIDFLGRIDSQVKVNGFRVELSEISAVLSEFPNITEATTIYTEINNNKAICSYFIANKKLNSNNIFEFLRKYLPNYMIPKYLIQLDSLPKNQNGKIDKNKLPKNFSKTNMKQLKLPKNKTEALLLSLFQHILNLENISTNDSFFDLGGDSLLAMRLQLECFKNNINITYGDIFNAPTIQELAVISTAEVAKYDNNFNDSLLIYNTKLKNNNSKLLNNTNLTLTPIGNVLLTGVTGFLGAHILDSFMKKENKIIYCLIRPKNNISAIQRLKDTLHFYFNDKYDSYIGNRIQCIEGDITHLNLGFSPDTLNLLKANLTTVIHSAALVKHFGNFIDFENINIKGTQNIVNFCKKYNLRLMHISTISVSGNNFAEGSYIENNNITEDIIYNEQNFYIGQNLDNLYIKSKFIAEKIILDEIQNNTLEAYIFRMGNLTSRYSEGKFQQNHFENSFVNRIKSILEIGYFPDYLQTGYTEFTPIDYCGDAIIDIANHYNNNFSIFHLLNDNHLTMLDFQKILQSLNIDIKIVNAATFDKIINSLIQDTTNSQKLEGIIRDFNSEKKLVYSSNIKINSEFTKDFLSKIGFYWPIIDKRYIQNYLKYLSDVGYININLKED